MQIILMLIKDQITDNGLLIVETCWIANLVKCSSGI